MVLADKKGAAMSRRDFDTVEFLFYGRHGPVSAIEVAVWCKTRDFCR
jgi:hypothetical protein